MRTWQVEMGMEDQRWRHSRVEIIAVVEGLGVERHTGLADIELDGAAVTPDVGRFSSEVHGPEPNAIPPTRPGGDAIGKA